MEYFKITIQCFFLKNWCIKYPFSKQTLFVFVLVIGSPLLQADGILVASQWHYSRHPGDVFTSTAVTSCQPSFSVNSVTSCQISTFPPTVNSPNKAFPLSTGDVTSSLLEEREVENSGLVSGAKGGCGRTGRGQVVAELWPPLGPLQPPPSCPYLPS